MLHTHIFLKTLLSIAVKKMQLNKQLEPLKMLLLLVCPALSFNVLRASEGRETKALNCKPITNLKEISELSNYSKTSGFRLHAVSC